MQDLILERFLRNQLAPALELASQSDVLDLVPDDDDPPQRYIAYYRLRTLTWLPGGRLGETEAEVVHLRFPDNYLQTVDPIRVVQIHHPLNLYHPNIYGPAVCPGHLFPGTELTDLLRQLYDILSYRKYTCHEKESLNPEAAAWARGRQEMFPTDPRPLTRQTPRLRIEGAWGEGSQA